MMVRADLLKLYRRRALMAWSAALFLGAQLAFYGYGEARHLAAPGRYGSAGGSHGLANAIMLLSYLGGVGAVMIGTAAGGADAASGVLRDLVSTGRSRTLLFAVRLPAALLVTLAFAMPGAAVAVLGAQALSGPGTGAVSTAVAVQAGLAACLALAVTAVLAVGLASVVSSQSIAIGLLLGWNLALSRVLEHVVSLGAVRQLLPEAATARFVPASVGGVPVVAMSAGVAVAVLVLWTAVFCLAGAWRTARRDV